MTVTPDYSYLYYERGFIPCSSLKTTSKGSLKGLDSLNEMFKDKWIVLDDNRVSDTLAGFLVDCRSDLQMFCNLSQCPRLDNGLHITKRSRKKDA